jgi:hypothetical protein
VEILTQEQILYNQEFSFFMMITAKRGQGAAGAAVLLAIIVGLIIFFIIVIPPVERAKILGEEIPSPADGEQRVRPREGITELLVTLPGRIDLLRQQEIEHAIPAVTIYTRTESAEIERLNSLYVKRTVVSAQSANMTFTLDDLPHTSNVLLSFNVRKGTGRLQVRLNGQEIINKELDTGYIRSIELSPSLLQEENVLTFAVSSPGAALWATNEYQLEDIAVVADITSTVAQRATSTFLISETEFNALEKIKLELFPVCDIETVGPLTVSINGNEIYHGVPDCNGQKVPLEFSPNLVQPGENTVSFMVDEGHYQLSHIILKSQLERVDFPTYYFELSTEQYGNVTAGDKRVMIRMDFVGTVTSKEGVLVINGRRLGFDTRELSFDADISGKVVRGNNAITIKPTKTLEIRELAVWLE